MGQLVDTLIYSQKEMLVELKKEYLEYLEQNKDETDVVLAARDRVIAIDNELKAIEKPIRPAYYG